MLSLLEAASGLNVAVAGATGRTGQLVVSELLSQGHRVVALTPVEVNPYYALVSRRGPVRYYSSMCRAKARTCYARKVYGKLAVRLRLWLKAATEYRSPYG